MGRLIIALPVSSRGAEGPVPASATMLIERVFGIGGVICVALGFVLLYAFATTGASYPELLLSGGISVGLGVLLWMTGRKARQQRLALLELAEPAASPSSPGPPGR